MKIAQQFTAGDKELKDFGVREADG